jgi:triacylglycerol lipase
MVIDSHAKRATTDWSGPDIHNDAVLFHAGAHPFEPARTDFSKNNAWWLAELSFAVYQGNEGLKGLSREDKLPFEGGGIRFFSYIPLEAPGTGDIGVQAALFRASQYGILAFRGTDTAPDWLTNAAAAMVETPHGRAHLGFWTAIHGPGSHWEEIRAALAFHGKPIWITGHSQGAALALLAAMDAKEHGIPVAGVYVYGCPRVGDAALASAMPSPVFRVVNETDVVTHVPVPIPLVLPYKHAGERVWLDSAGDLHTGEAPRPDLAAIQELFDFAGKGREARAPDVVLKMHAARVYAAKLWNLLV